MDLDVTRKHCSFCGAVGGPRKQLYGGLGAFICADCAEAASASIASYRAAKTAPSPPWASMTRTELLSKLWLIAQTGHEAEDFLAEWVQLVRSRGASWIEVGKALGISRDAARHRFTVHA